VEERYFSYFSKFKLVKYSATYWMHHARATESQSKAVSKKLLNLLSQQRKVTYRRDA
jgi:ankyrin repeat protein